MTRPPRKRKIELIRRLPEITDRATSVAIGNFDGLHLGHRAVIAHMLAAARATALTPSVLTFEPHPRRFFAPTSADFRLISLSEKLRLLADAGVARVAMPRFDAAFAAMPAEVFLQEILEKKLGARAVITGENFVFGRGRGGDVALLKRWGEARGIAVLTVPPVTVNGQICSSSAVRAALMAGEVKTAETLLGRPYTLAGNVVHGDGRGKTIGFPTANVALTAGLLLLAYGVYAVRARVAEAEYSGVANLGLRPTVAVDSVPKLEVHLFDVTQDFYGNRAEIRFVDKIRNEMKFDSMENLRAQIARDCGAARALLAEMA